MADSNASARLVDARLWRQVSAACAAGAARATNAQDLVLLSEFAAVACQCADAQEDIPLQLSLKHAVEDASKWRQG